VVPRAGALLVGLRHDQVAAGLINLARNLSISPAIRHPTGKAVAFHRMLSRYRADAFTVDFRNPFDGIVGGGDLDPANPNSADTAISNNGGQTWTLTNPPPVTGAIFGLSYVGQTGGGSGNNLGRAVVVTANDGGAAWTPDEGNTCSRCRV
jgi:hypothetical protein